MSVEYTYFDSFSDVEVDLSPYITSLTSTTGNSYSFTNLQSVKTTMKNLFDQTDLVETFKKSFLYFDSYLVQDNERPEDIAKRYYNTVDHFWIICLFNNVKMLFNDWAMTDEQIQSLATHYYNTENKYTYQTYYELIHERNERKRNILILKPFYLNEVISSFRAAVEGN